MSGLKREGYFRAIPLTTGDGVREVARTVLLGANVADTARIKGEHYRLWERGGGGRGERLKAFL